MPQNKIKKLIKESIIDILDRTTSKKKINHIINKHNLKLHFVPVKYRILGGLLQSLNIQFGNFIEILIHKIVEEEKNLEIIKNISGKKNIPLTLSIKTDNLIDNFITKRQENNNSNLETNFDNLLNDITQFQLKTENFITAKHDVDLLFKNKRDGIIYYVEIKYNDDHDTGKFVDINRKFLKTYAGLTKVLKTKKQKELKPILYYLNKKIMKGNIYIPEKNNIYRGDKLFNEFFSLKYKDLDNYLRNISEDKEILDIFDKLYKKIRYK